MNRASGSVVEAPRRVLLGRLVLLFGLGTLHLGQLLQCLLDPRQLLFGRTVLGLLSPNRGLLQPLGLALNDRQVVAGFLTGLFQGFPLLEAVGPGADPDAGAVLGNPVDGHSLALDQYRQHLGQQVVQSRLVVDPEIAEGVIVERHPAAEPAIRVALAAEPVQFAGAGDSPGCGVEPQCDQEPRVGRSPTRLLATGPDGRQETAEVPGQNDGPDSAGVVILGEEFVQRAGTHGHLLAVGPSQTWGWQGPGIGLRPGGRFIHAVGVG